MKIVDILGQRFGRLLVKSIAGRTPRGKVRWLCECDCGQSVDVMGEALRRGYSNSCGCLRRELAAVRDPVGDGVRYGRLVIATEADDVVRTYDNEKHNTRMVIARCDCGSETTTSWNSLRRGRTKSCGCFRAECGVTRARHLWDRVR